MKSILRNISPDDPSLDRGLARVGAGPILDPRVQAEVRAIFEDVRERGDAAMVDALDRFDGCRLEPDRLRVSEVELESAERQVPREVMAAIRGMVERLRYFHGEVRARSDWRAELDDGSVVGETSHAIASAGLYVPGGRGCFASTLVQLAVPALVAGVDRIVVATPPMNAQGDVHPAVLAAAQELGLQHVVRCNGVAGIAALAIGTESLTPVRKVVGPGSSAVQAAQVAAHLEGCVSFMIFGPSEALVIADDAADPTLTAVDLLTEAEHGSDSIALLVTPSRELSEAVAGELATRLDLLPEPRRAFAASALGKTGGVVLVDDLDQAAAIANRFAPEHLQLIVREPEPLLARIRHAGEVLVGPHTPFSMANYAAGVPHALPTGGFAQVASAITARTFMKTMTVLQCSEARTQRLGPEVVAFAEHDGFPAHAGAVAERIGSG